GWLEASLFAIAAKPSLESEASVPDIKQTEQGLPGPARQRGRRAPLTGAVGGWTRRPAGRELSSEFCEARKTDGGDAWALSSPAIGNRLRVESKCASYCLLPSGWEHQGPEPEAR
ncbi:unnamed protein product, partial [Gulo gulo]